MPLTFCNRRPATHVPDMVDMPGRSASASGRRQVKVRAASWWSFLIPRVRLSQSDTVPNRTVSFKNPPHPHGAPGKFTVPRSFSGNILLLKRESESPAAFLSYPDDAETRETSAPASGNHDWLPDAPTAHKKHQEEQHKRQHQHQHPRMGPAAPAAAPGARRWRRMEPERDGVFPSKVGPVLSCPPFSAPALVLYHTRRSSSREQQ